MERFNKSNRKNQLPNLIVNRTRSQDPRKPYSARLTVNIPNFKGMISTRDEANIQQVVAMSRKRTDQTKDRSFQSRGSARSLAQTRKSLSPGKGQDIQGNVTFSGAEAGNVSMLDENPWIKGINAEEMVEGMLGKPARRYEVAKLREKTKPSNVNALSFRINQNEILPPAASELPGGSIERTRRIMQGEFEHIDFTTLKASRDLSKFDCWDKDETGEYWAEFYKGKTAQTSGISPVYIQGDYIWQPVTLLGYDSVSKRFKVQLENGVQRSVHRLSLRFHDEDPVLFDQRLNLAKELQANFESDIAAMNYVDEVPVTLVSQLLKETQTRILQKTVKPFIGFNVEQNMHIFKRLMEVVVEEYVRAMKKCIVQREMDDPENDAHFEALKVPIIREKKVVPEFGTMTIPAHPYKRNRKSLMEGHWYNINEVVQVNKILAAKSHSFHELKYLQTKGLQMPMELQTFFKNQNHHHNSIKQQILIHWRDNIISETHDKMPEKYNFFAMMETDEYKDSELHQVLRRIDLVMNYHIRTFAKESIDDWLEFLEAFATSHTPLLTLHLSIVKPSAATKDKKDEKKEEEKKDEEKKAEGEEGEEGEKAEVEEARPLQMIEFKPTLNKACNFMLDCIDWISDSTNKVGILEADLVPFMNIEKTPAYEMTEDNPWTVAAKARISEMMEIYSKDPSELLSFYKDFEWIVQLDIQKYLDSLFSDTPSTDKLRKLITDLRQAVYEVQNISNDYVNFKFFQVESERLKFKIKEKGERAIKSILKRISKYCTEGVASVLEEYSAMQERLDTVPTSEDELFELKSYYRNIKNLKLDQEKKVESIQDHLNLLEEFEFRYEMEETAKFFSTLQWPTEIDVAYKDGETQLEEAEDKFKTKLDKEKERYYKELQQLTKDFDAVQQFDDFNNYTQMFDEVKQLEYGLDEAMEKLKSFNTREGLFELPQSDRSDLQKIMNDFDPYKKLWTNVNDFLESDQKWIQQMKVKELPANEIVSKVDLWYRECFVLAKKLNERSPEAAYVINNLKEHIETFQLQLPLIKALSNEALQDNHWHELTKIAKLDDRPLNSNIETVSSLNEKGLQNYIEEIEDMSDRAQREYRLMRKLQDMQKDWEDKVLELREHKETFIIATIEEIQTLLDDQVVTAQAMKTSRYIKPVEGKCRDWEARLLLVQETLDEWIKCQRTWMYLEPIFSSDDIMRQMPVEGRKFMSVDTTWRNLMDATSKEPNVLDAINAEGTTRDSLKEANKKLDEISKELNSYLETKRAFFPRFYFISNDDLLDILSTTKDPLKVQDHLNKCFEAIEKVNFDEKQRITAMQSAEKEEVQFLEMIDVNEGAKKGNVELWMGELESAMFKTMWDITKKSLQAYAKMERTEWVRGWPGQVVLGVSQVYWTTGVEEAFEEGKKRSMQDYTDKLGDQIQDIVKMVRGQLAKLLRVTLGAMLTIDVHARDEVQKLVDNGVVDPQNFDWLAQLRYYWEQDTMWVRMINASLKYGFEYLGNTPRLVITALTDRCYRTLMGAYSLYYGGSPEGPAGTGKTESVKDLARAVAVKCVVFNCSDGLDYKQMGRFFKGLASSGSWCCFDEFNRISPSVLSVIAMQVLTIQLAVRERKKVFMFDDAEIPLVLTVAMNTTMNPGYAGRSDLPDNLKALFRPCAMMIPDYANIAEISLFSFGYADSPAIARKLAASLKLSSEQLSDQNHYDFGMRAVKAIINRAGQLKMKHPDDQEDILALRALNDVNVPKFTSNDIPLFNGIVSDLFPGVVVPEIDYGILLTAIIEAAERNHLQPTEVFQGKCIQLYETVQVRHGLMMVGQTFSGKSSATFVLGEAIESIKDDPEFMKVHKKYINPKSITQKQLYGNFNENTHEWSDGVIADIIRLFSNNKTNERKWVIFDGPVDAIWIENMNTVLDDNKMLCLNSGEIIRMSENMTMMFEVEDLKEASPATVSRCGMVYLEPIQLGWEVLIHSYMFKLPPPVLKFTETITIYFRYLLHPLIEFTRKKCRVPVPVTENEFTYSALKYFDCFMMEWKEGDDDDEADIMDSPLKESKNEIQVPKDYEDSVKNMILFSVVYAIGGTIDERSKEIWHEFLSKLIDGEDVKAEYDLLDCPEDWEAQPLGFKLPPNPNFFEMVYQKKGDSYVWNYWSQLMDKAYSPAPELEFNQIIVPTKDSLCLQYLINFTAINKNLTHLLVGGPTGTGKTMTILNELRNTYYNEKWTHTFMAFSAQTSANKTQFILEGSLEKRRKNTYAPPNYKRMIVMVDDLNMPQKEQYGAQPPIEFLRQWMDYDGWYDLETNEFRWSQDIQFITGMGPPGSGRNHITQRYLRHYVVFYVVPFDEESLSKIFGSVMDWFFNRQEQPFGRSVMTLKENCVNATIALFKRVQTDLLPTPVKMHYTYNLRDVGKVFQGIALSTPVAIKDDFALIRLWAHECQRIFQDRLINDSDRQFFTKLLKEVMKEQFNREWSTIVTLEPILFASFVPTIVKEEGSQPVNDVYCELTNRVALTDKINDCLEFYNQINTVKMNLVMFMNAIEHVIKIVRIMQFTSGNGLMVGVGGSGRKSLTSLSASICDMSVFQIELTRSYGNNEWAEDLRIVLKQAGMQNKPTVFLFNDTQIAKEAFLEDVNNILNNGDVPNLFETEDMSEICEVMKDVAIARRLGTSPAELYAMFVERVRENLHMVICLSPIGEDFRRRLRMFPSLVNCCTIDWFLPWPQDALHSVANQFLQEVDLEEDVRAGIVDICVDMQERVTQLARVYLQQLRRYYYVTPTSYLELINTFTGLLENKRMSLRRQLNRYEVGLEKLLSTASSVATMQAELEALQPKLKQAAEDTAAMMIDLTQQQEEADKSRANCEVEEAKCTEEADKAQAIKDECEKELAVAMPAYNEAIKALNTITKNDMVEIKNLPKPPPAVRLTMETICIMFEFGPARVKNNDTQKMEDDYWPVSKQKVLSDPKLMEKLMTYDKDNIEPKVIEKVTPYLAQPNFEVANVKKASKAAEGLCKWVRAMVVYDKVAKQIAPRKAALAEAEGTLKDAQDALAITKAELQKILDLLEKLQSDYDAAVAEEARLHKEVATCLTKLDRAEKLIDGLSGEKTRWADAAESLKTQLTNVVGDILISSGIIAYLGVFTASYRIDALSVWTKLLHEKKIPSSESFALQAVLGDAVKIRDWNICGLPNDSLSIDNGIILEQAKRWPLMIDPQLQANTWIKKMHGDNLKIIRLSQDDYQRNLETGIIAGIPVLLENIGEILDPVLDPLLSTKKGSTETIRLGDRTVDLTSDFMFYITTKLPKPHYSPEICVKVCLINFLVTEDGLLDQMLAQTVATEAPNQETQRLKCIADSAKFKKELKDTEDKILELLSNATGDILDDNELIDTLTTSKEQSKYIEEQLVKQERTQERINETRKDYKPVAFRVSQLFFTIADLCNVEPMYQYSLDWFVRIFLNSMSFDDSKNNIGERVKFLQIKFTSLLYENVCRSLFEKDKLLIAFLMTVKIMTGQDRCDAGELRFLMTGGVKTEADRDNPTKTDGEWLTDKQWINLCEMDELSCFPNFSKEFEKSLAGWKSIWDSEDPQNEEWPDGWTEKLNPLQQIILMRIIRPDRVIAAIQHLIVTEIGQEFVQPPPFDLELSYKDSKNMVPIVFILSPGADPILEIKKLAQKRGFANKWKPMSLGDGQGEKAEREIEAAIDHGTWVVLQNCHLATDWMPTLEKKVEEIDEETTHSDFRLWLTCMPSNDFPVSILQNGIKITNEPPKGIKANLVRSYNSYDVGEFDSVEKQYEWRRLCYSLSFFHAIIQERLKFGALGWNIPYAFSMSDLAISFAQLRIYLDQYDEIPWKALRYCVAETNYGGRVTDEWDRRCISTILEDFYTKKVLNENHTFDEAGVYAVPPEGNIQDYLLYIREELPRVDITQVFGMHENASMTAFINDSEGIMGTSLSLLPRTTSGAGKSQDELLTETALDIHSKVPKPYDIEAARAKYKVSHSESMNTVLVQELMRFNKLINMIRSTVIDLKDAIAGSVVMSGELESLGDQIFDNKIPAMWQKVSYPSKKPLGSWLNDLLARLKMLQDWLDNGPPASYWISGFFFTQSFLTGMMQNYARKYNIAIDTLCYDFEVLDADISVESITSPPEDGCYVYGMYLDGARWVDGALEEALPKILYYPVPIFWLKPVKTMEKVVRHVYVCPVYKTSARAGVLSTTGQSTNFVLPIDLIMQKKHKTRHWIKRGTALLTQLDY